jgi:hypothetical protein
MQNITIISNWGRIIRIEDTAWQMQLAYIETLHGYFVNEEGRFEIINDIENRIAELMLEMVNRQNGFITEIEIERIIQIMGTVDEFRKLDTDDWDTSIASTEHYNTNDSASAIKSGCKLNENYLGKTKLCCN